MILPRPEDIENRNYSFAPFVAGCNLESPRFFQEPGTLASCFNYEITSLGYERSQGLRSYDGTWDYPITNLWYVGDVTANVTISGAFTLGGEVTWANGRGRAKCVYYRNDVDVVAIGLVDAFNLEPVQVNAVFTDVESGNTMQITSGRVGQPLVAESAGGGFATDPSTTNVIAETVQDYLDFINEVNLALTAETANTWAGFKPRIPGIGGILGGFQFQDKVYAARAWPSVSFEAGALRPKIGDTIQIGTVLAQYTSHSLDSGTWEGGDAAGRLWLRPYDGGTYDPDDFVTEVTDGTTITNVTQSSSTLGEVAEDFSLNDDGKGCLWRADVGGWKFVDLGYSAKFDGGENVFNTQATPLYQAEQAGVVQATDWILPSAASNIGSTASPWSNPGNVLLVDGSSASCPIPTAQESDLLLVEWATGDYIPAEDSELTGIEIRINADSITGSRVELREVRLVDTSQDSTGERVSLNLAGYDTVPNSAIDLDYGGQNELWGWKGKEVTFINDGQLQLQIRLGNNSGNSDTVTIDYVQVKFHYTPKAQKVWFHDSVNAVDVGTGVIQSFNVFDGSWDTDDAQGWFTVHDVTTPEDVLSGCEIRTEAAGAGTLLAMTASSLEINELPSRYDQEGVNTPNRRNMWRTIEANFFGHDDGAAIFGCTGVSSAFMFDSDEKFAYIRVPVAPDQDVPRHVAFHTNHLLLSMGTHLVVSLAGSPTTFDGNQDASSWSIGDTITGLVPVDGNTTAVLCEESIHAFSGTFPDEFAVQNVNSKTGAREYTEVGMRTPIFVDYTGVATMESVAEFGDFKIRPWTAAISKWMRDRLQGSEPVAATSRVPVAAVPVRGKNQYRLFFDEGIILNLALPIGEGDIAKPMFGHYDPVTLNSKKYVPTWIDSYIMSSGRERIVMGTKEGAVWVVDGANTMLEEGVQNDIACRIVTNPLNNKHLTGASKTFTALLFGDFFEAQNLTYQTGIDYLFPTGKVHSKSVGTYEGRPRTIWQPSYVELYAGTVTDGFSYTIDTTMDGSQPHRFSGLLPRTSRIGSGRNNVQKNRG